MQVQSLVGELRYHMPDGQIFFFNWLIKLNLFLKSNWSCLVLSFSFILIFIWHRSLLPTILNLSLWNMKWSGKKTLENGKSQNWCRFSWWSSGWESACQCRGQFQSLVRENSHATGQLGLWTTNTDPVLSNEKPLQWEAPQLESSPLHTLPPLSATRRKPEQQQRSSEAKNK